MSDQALPDTLRRPHDDWPWPFSLIPRGWTASKKWGKPYQIAGNQTLTRPLYADTNAPSVGRWTWHGGGPSPIGEPGSWQLSRYPLADGWRKWVPYFAFTTKGGVHFRIGPRWDDVDDYVEFPSVAIKRGVKADGDR